MQGAFGTVARMLPGLLGTAAPAPALDSTPAGGAHEVAAAMIGPVVDWRGLEDTARTRKRIKAVEYSGFYHARLTLHRWLSFAMLPLFAGSYITGDQILKHSSQAPDWALKWHRPLATGTAVVFTANTVTGLWNLWDSRKDPAGRVKRYVHTLMFLAADAGFLYAGTVLAKDARNSEQKRREHRTVALASMGLSVTSWGLMLFFK